MKKIISVLACFLFVFAFAVPSYCASNYYSNRANDLEALSNSAAFKPGAQTSFDTQVPGLSVVLNKPIAHLLDVPKGPNSDYSSVYMDSQGQYGLDVIGVNVTLTNASSEFLTIKSGQSSIAMGNYSGIPFLPGMAYRDAGNPSATPDIIIPPNQSVSKTFLVSSCMFSDGWNVYGVLLPKLQSAAHDVDWPGE